MNFKLSSISFGKLLKTNQYEDMSVLIDFENLINSISRRNCTVFYNNNDLYSVEGIENIFGNSDEQKLLQKLLLQSSLLTSNDCEHFSEIGFINTVSNIITSEEELLGYFKQIINNANDADTILETFKLLYLNLLFLDNINQSMNIFNLKNIEVKENICAHLSAINANFKAFFENYKSGGLTTVMSYFGTANSINCSCENDRKLVNKYRTISIFDTSNQKNVTNLEFELHTKLDFSNLSERIYFSKGDSRVQQGRIIIGHIGKHLYDPQSGFKYNYAKLPKTVFVQY